MKNRNQQRLVSLGEAANRLDCSTRHVYNLIYSGDLKSAKIGASRKVLDESIDALIKRSIDKAISA